MLRNLLCPVLLTLQAGVTLAAVRPSRTVAVPAGSTQLAFVSTGDGPGWLTCSGAGWAEGSKTCCNLRYSFLKQTGYSWLLNY